MKVGVFVCMCVCMFCMCRYVHTQGCPCPCVPILRPEEDLRVFKIVCPCGPWESDPDCRSLWPIQAAGKLKQK